MRVRSEHDAGSFRVAPPKGIWCSYGSVGRSMEKSGKFEFRRLGLA